MHHRCTSGKKPTLIFMTTATSSAPAAPDLVRATESRSVQPSGPLYSDRDAARDVYRRVSVNVARVMQGQAEATRKLLAALASGVLLLTFAVAMTTALGPEAPLSYSVWTAAAGAFLLAQDRPAASWAPHSREKPSTEVASSGISSGPVSTCHSQ